MNNRLICILVILGGFVFGSNALSAASVFGVNLIVNGDAESGPSDPDGHNPVSSFPGWTVSGAPDVNQYASGYDIGLTDIIPLSAGNNYFSGGRAQATSGLSQTIDLSSGSSSIDEGTVTYSLAGYLGGFQSETESAQLSVAFLDGGGNQLSSVTVGPVTDLDRADTTGLWYRRAIGPVPTGARSAQVVLQFNWTSDATNDGAADNLALVLNIPVSAQALLGSNLIVNGNAESPAVPAGTLLTTQAVNVPGWSQEGLFTIDSYTDTGGDLTTTSPGPPNPGNNFFYGGPDNAMSSASQAIDVSSAASLIDSGTVQYALSAWLGGYDSQNDNATLTVQFEDWNSNSLGTATLGPVQAADRDDVSELLPANQNGAIPAGTRQINLLLTMTRTDGSDNDGMADNLSLVLSGSGGGTPAIASGGIVSAAAFGGFTSIAPGSWIEIYGSNLAPDTRGWTGSDFSGSSAPTSLDGVQVTIGGQNAFIDYISAGQVNAQVPSNVGTGTQQIVVSNGDLSSTPYSITVNATEPGLLAPPSSFTINGNLYVVALLPDGTYVLPTGAIAGVTSRPANPGETVTMYGVGFGPVTPDIPAGQIVGQANQLSTPISISIGGVPATVTYQGLAPSYVGLYQFNVVIPNIAANNAAPLTFSQGGTPGQQTLFIAVN